MKRVHPDFARKMGELLEREELDKATQQAKDAIQYWANVITDEIGGLSKGEMPFVIAALRIVADAYGEIDPEVGTMAEAFLGAMKIDAYAFVSKR
ncbi:MAG: hypothetical protein Q4C59_10325 [Lachnospiraceae bacterium]|nr:hypothetical protein [Lachnospiraceae bacterium]